MKLFNNNNIMISHAKTLKIFSTFIFILFTIMSFGAEICDNGIDDDNDGLIDCGDHDCYADSACDDAFECTNSLFQVITKDLKALDVSTSSYEFITTATSNYNGAGFNVQDGYIYGINKSGSNFNLFKIANEGIEENLGAISGFSGINYAGDFDLNGNLYTYKSGSFPSLYHVDVNATTLVHINEPLENLYNGSIPGAADITYNPLLKKFLGLSSTQKLIVIDPIGLTIDLKSIPSGMITTKGAFGAAYSDVEGNTYFSNNTDGRIFKVVFNNEGEFLSISHVANGAPTNSNDGMSCSQSLPPFETSCSDGVDNDGDGLVDCADPDCFVDATCPIISAELFCQPQAGPNTIVPFYLRLVNNSQAAADTFTISDILPADFSFLSDSLSFSGILTESIIVDRPTEGDVGQVSWTFTNLPVGDTIEISYSVLLDGSIEAGESMDSVFATGVLLQPGFISHTIEHYGLAETEFVCEPAFYQVYKKRGEPNVFAKLNIATGLYEEIGVISHQANGLGFDYSTGYAYGSDGKRFIKLDQDGVVTDMDLSFDKKVFVGDVDTLGNWYGKVGNNIVKVIIADLSDSTFNDQGMPGWDMAYNEDGNFYAAHNKTLYKYNTTTNVKSTVGSLIGADVPNGGFGAQWTGSDGMLYISHNSTGKIFRVNIVNRDTKLMMTTTSGLQFNDGFSCPTELPAPLTFDYSDNSRLPLARLFTYSQSTNNTPNLNGVWAGSKINYEAQALSNDQADGDSFDDGLTYPTLLQPDSTVTFQLGLNSNYSQTAHYGLWIDWNADMVADSFYSGSKMISGIDQVNLSIKVPATFADGFISVRLMVAEGSLTESDINIQSSMTGEVEDYYFHGSSTINCSDGLDDDMDGLIDCDDPDCYDSCKYTDTKSAYEGGLESNGRLSHKVSETNFDKKMGKIATRSERSQQGKINKSTFYQDAKKLKNGNQASIRSYIPLGVIPNTTTTESSPEHLISITNATDIFSIDIYDDINPDSRKGAVLGLTSADGVYEHTKYVCDRLAGSSILDVLTYEIDLDGTEMNLHKLIIPKLQLAEGSVEYATSFSVRDTIVGGVNKYIFESHWNLDDYTKNVGYHNFQVWAGNTRDLELLVKEIYRLITNTDAMNGSGREIEKYTIGDAPVFFINNAQYVQDSLILQITNKANLNNIILDGEYSLSETMVMEDLDTSIVLNGQTTERVAINVGRVFDMGLTFYHASLNVRDAIFLADGTWNTSYDDTFEAVASMDVTPGTVFTEDRHEIDRNINLDGTVKNYITLYRSFNPNFTGIDLDGFETVSFTISGTGAIEVAAVKESIDSEDWDLQGKYLLELTEEPRTYHLTKEHFKNTNDISQDWSDLFMMVFTVVGDGYNTVDFDVNIADLYFGNDMNEDEFMVFTSESMITPISGAHTANAIDGTDRGQIPMTASFEGDIMEIHIKNLGDTDLSLEDMFIDAPNNHFELIGFEPTSIGVGEVTSLQVKYSPDTYPVQSAATVVLTINGVDTYSFELLGQTECPSTDLVKTEDIVRFAYGITKEYKSSELLQATSNIDAGRSIMFKGGQSVELLSGFEIQSGSSIDVIIQDDCNID